MRDNQWRIICRVLLLIVKVMLARDVKSKGELGRRDWEEAMRLQSEMKIELFGEDEPEWG